MKKNLKRPLVLAKETLHSLTNIQLVQIAGGGVAASVVVQTKEVAYSCGCNTTGSGGSHHEM